ncbi:MAG: phosphate ABC transporter substrate-binding protein [Elusimicrobiota bacterium]|jgi:phosphate transport system substrate-binding protein|nr:phosphate ABC transporter substrate-binding protein [Elusimicrobiota bacterium]
MRKNIFLSICLFLFLFLISCANERNSKGNSIQIKGSDTMVNLVQVWAEKFVENRPEVNVGVTGGGSGTGFAALINETCDIAMSSRKIEDREEDEAAKNNLTVQEIVVGLDGLVILVNKDNPINELTMDQARDIFMRNVSNWKELGGDDLEIVILSREGNSGTHMFFKEKVLRRGNPKAKDEFSPYALLMPSSQAIFDEVSQNPHAVGYVGMGFSNDEVKVLKIAKDKKSKYIAPTPGNILSNSYPISRLLFLYTKKDSSVTVKEFISFALSPEGQKIVLETDFVPIK